MDGAATHCLTARPLRVAAPRRHPPKRQRSTVEGFLEASATAFFVLGLPVVAAAIALAGARYVPETRRRELLAALLVHGASTGLVALPLAVCGLHGYHRRTSALHQLCATHLVWNAHLVAPGLSFYPFLVESFLLRSDPGTHAGVLRDTTSYFVWCCAPLVLATGAVKGVATRRRERFGWRHRAGLGGACFLVFAVYVWTQRSSASLPATLAASMAFYLYAAASYLPPQPEADGPEITGAREWPALRVWLKPFLLDAVEAYLGLEVVRDAPAPRRSVDAAALQRLERAAAATREAINEVTPLAPTAEIRRAVRDLSRAAATLDGLAASEERGERHALREGEACLVGFHPHGVVPFDAALATLRWPCGKAVVCTDAFTHVIPWMRDLGQWLGAREVTREAIGLSLRSGASVVLVPGGQAELFATSSYTKQVRIYRGHRGFVRVALQHRARLVPAFSFGEWELMDNVSMEGMQRWTRSWLGFPVPFWPYGRWGLPLPRRPPRGVRVVVGRPVDLPVDGAVDEAAVEACHRAYFEALFDLFERHKERAGYGDHELVFFDSALDAVKKKSV